MLIKVKHPWRDCGKRMEAGREEESARRLSPSAEIVGKELFLSKIPIFFLKGGEKNPYCIKGAGAAL